MYYFYRGPHIGHVLAGVVDSTIYIGLRMSVPNIFLSAAFDRSRHRRRNINMTDTEQEDALSRNGALTEKNRSVTKPTQKLNVTDAVN